MATTFKALLERRITVDATPSVVWGIVRDIRRIPEWSPQVVSVKMRDPDGDIRLGSLKVPKGTYALFTIPSPGGWTLILNKVAKQWGAYSYDSKQDLGRTPMAIMQAANPVEQLTISIEPVDKGGTLQIAWDKTVATAPITP